MSEKNLVIAICLGLLFLSSVAGLVSMTMPLGPTKLAILVIMGVGFFTGIWGLFMTTFGDGPKN